MVNGNNSKQLLLIKQSELKIRSNKDMVSASRGLLKSSSELRNSTDNRIKISRIALAKCPSPNVIALAGLPFWFPIAV